MDTSRTTIFLALVCSVTLVHGYKTDAPDFSNEPLTTLPPITPQQQQYITLLNFVAGNTPLGPVPPFPGLSGLNLSNNSGSAAIPLPNQGNPQGLPAGLPNLPNGPPSGFPQGNSPVGPPSGASPAGQGLPALGIGSAPVPSS